MIIQISSRTNAKIKYVISLRNKKVRKEEDRFVSEGKKAMQMALSANLLEEVYTTKELNLPSEIRQYIVNNDILDKISQTINPEGVVFISKIPHLELKNTDLILYLDNIQDPGNLGTLIRSALALGFNGVALSNDCCDPFNDKAIAASKGAFFNIPIFYEDLEKFKMSHQIVVSTLSDDSRVVEAVRMEKKTVLVLGNEAHGVSKKSLDLADIKVKIPMHKMDSLNVASAGAILMYEMSKNKY